MRWGGPKLGWAPALGQAAGLKYALRGVRATPHLGAPSPPLWEWLVWTSHELPRNSLPSPSLPSLPSLPLLFFPSSPSFPFPPSPSFPPFFLPPALPFLYSRVFPLPLPLMMFIIIRENTPAGVQYVEQFMPHLGAGIVSSCRYCLFHPPPPPKFNIEKMFSR